MRTLSEILWPWRLLTWPNRITLGRLLLVAPFVVVTQRQQAHDAYRYAALGIFAAMAFSDMLDGVLARRLHCSSRLGAILDPLADKTLIICAAVLLSLPQSAVPGARLPQWVAVMVIGKDLWVLVGFLVVFVLTGNTRARPNRFGKACTAAQLAMVAAILLAPDLNRLGVNAGYRFARALWWLVSILSGLAVVSYTRLGLALIARADHGDSDQHFGSAA